jgi:hypothetical protein
MRSSEVLKQVLDMNQGGVYSLCECLHKLGYTTAENLGAANCRDVRWLPSKEREEKTNRLLGYVRAYSRHAHETEEAMDERLGDVWFSYEERVIALEHAIEFAESLGD